jgi:hypothetical protein
MPEPETADPREGAKYFDQPILDPVSFACKVLIDDMWTGLATDNDSISLTDKIETQVKFTSDADIHVQDQLTITYPDGHVLNVRVVERNVSNPYTQQYSKFTGVVSGVTGV